MKLKSAKLRMFLCVLVLFTFQAQVWAPPGYYPHYHWIERSFAYASYFCNRTNPDYLRFEGHDCANFCSQIANAGCSGMAESNNTNNWSTVWAPPNGDCWDYFNYEPSWQTANDCNPDYITANYVPCPTGYHTVIANAEAQSWWFYCSNSDWPDQKVDAYSTSDIPIWIQRGCFAFAHWTGGGWHAVYIGDGQGGSARYYAHTNDQCGTAISGLFGSDTHLVEFYGPIVISIEE